MSDCACDHCVNCCANGNPGWFMPGEAEKAAEFLKMTFSDFKEKYLVTDFWITDRHGDVDILAPIKTIPDAPKVREKVPRFIQGMLDNLTAKARATPGGRAPHAYAYHPGRCTFLDGNNRCSIHPVKPYECRMSGHEDQKSWRRIIAAAWLRLRRNRT